MAEIRTIYLTNELNEKLRKEENVSLLISQLLEQYYKMNVSKISEIEERQKTIEEERKKFNEKYSDDYATLENRKSLIKKECETEEESKERQRKKREDKINNILSSFKDVMKREMSKEELSDYLYRLENESGFTFYKFIDDKREIKS